MRAVLVVLAGSAVLLGGAVSSGAGGTSEEPKLSERGKELLAARIASGADHTMLIVATQGQSNSSVVSAIESQGGVVRYRDDDLGYARAWVPTSKVVEISATPGIEAVDLDEKVPLPDPPPDAGEGNAPSVDQPGPTTPGENPYLPTRDIGAPQFVASHPTYDGRGVVIGIIDTGVDVLTPELQTAKKLNGTPVRKIRDSVTSIDPDAIDPVDPTWLTMNTEVTAKDGTFTVDQTTYTAPRKAGHFSFAPFAEIALGTENQYRGDVNRDGDTSDVFAVLWNRAETVWVDTNQNASFADEREMHRYSRRFDVGTFGTDDPATPIREIVPFVVQIARRDRAVNIGIVASAHGTHVAGIAAGKDFFGSPDNPNDSNFDGAAPEAQIVSVRACDFVGCSVSAIFEGMIYLAETAKVDLINMSIGDVFPLNDGNDPLSMLINRLIKRHKIQMFFAAGNDGPGVNTVAEPSVATHGMSVAGYVHADTWLSHLGAVAAKRDGLFPFSSRGPREDGGLKPEIVAPGAAFSTVPAWQVGLQPGYRIIQGTSMAAPQAAGGSALLLSGAKQAGGVPFGPDELRQAINSSAVYLPAYGAYEQGNGLMSVGGAWSILTEKVRPVEITSAAPVNTVLADFLPERGSGSGIHEREGWRPGDSGTRSITLMRVSPGKDTYNLSWTGNDGTFGSLPASVTLRHNAPVSIPVSIHTATAGAHSALLRVDSPVTPGVDHSVMNTVVAAPDIPPASDVTVTQSVTVDRPDTGSVFFRVPPGTPAVTLTVHGAGDTSSPYPGRVRLLRFHPFGVPLDSIGTLFVTGGPQTKTLTNPDEGVWEAVVEASRISTEVTATYSVTAEWRGVIVDPTLFTVDPTTIGTPYSKAFTFTNHFGAFTGNAHGTPLTSVFSSRPTIAAGRPPHVYDIVVPEGSESILARIENPSDRSADLDLSLFDCTSGTCILRSRGVGAGSSRKIVHWTSPAAGAWRVVVEPLRVPSGSTAYDYLDLVWSPTFGSVTVNDPEVLHPDGDVWSATATAIARVAPGPGRVLQGAVHVTSGETVLGQAKVELRNIRP